MEAQPVLYIRGIQCAPEFEEKFNKWFEEIHIPMLLKSNWVDGATRYKLAPVLEEEAPTYVTICEFKNRQAFEAWSASPELVAAAKEREETWPIWPDEIKTMWRGVYEPIKTWHK